MIELNGTKVFFGDFHGQWNEDMTSAALKVAGYRFGLFMNLWDNDGEGMKSSLQWPSAVDSKSGKVWYCIDGGTWAQVQLVK